VQIISSRDEAVQEKALTAIANLCVDDRIFSLAPLPPIIRSALQARWFLTISMLSATNRQEFRHAGVTEKVVLALSSSSDDVVKRALTVIVNTSFDCTRPLFS
jgi:hypothetical protein